MTTRPGSSSHRSKGHHFTDHRVGAFLAVGMSGVDHVETAAEVEDADPQLVPDVLCQRAERATFVR